MSSDWYRNKTWNTEVERTFDERLRRARRKAQYLRIQAGMLAKSHPTAALGLLDRYFALNDHFGDAQAHVDRAEALLALGRVDDAIESYNAALLREAEFPNLLTQAYLCLPFLVAVRRIREQYDHAVLLLNKHKARLMFPVDHFLWHAALALIAADLNDSTSASDHARYALDAFKLDHSGFRYHPTVGLVTGRYDAMVRELKLIARI